MSLTTMNVHHSCIRDKLKILRRQLLYQQNTGSNHNDGLRSIRLQLLHRIKDTNVGLTTAGREHTNTFRMLLESIQGILLVGTELKHLSLCVCIHYNSKKGGLWSPLCQFLKCPRISSSTETNLVYRDLEIMSSHSLTIKDKCVRCNTKKCCDTKSS
jgi:hypothetical protein